MGIKVLGTGRANCKATIGLIEQIAQALHARPETSASNSDSMSPLP